MRDDGLPVDASRCEQGQRASHRERIGVGAADGQLSPEDVVGSYGDFGVGWSYAHPKNRPARFGSLHRSPHRLGATDAFEYFLSHSFGYRLRLYGLGADFSDMVPPARIGLADEDLGRARRHEECGAQNSYRAGSEDQCPLPRT